MTDEEAFEGRVGPRAFDAALFPTTSSTVIVLASRHTFSSLFTLAELYPIRITAFELASSPKMLSSGASPTGSVGEGNIYNLPADLGTFDVSVFGAILLHLRDPWTAIAEAARRTSQTIVITDVLEEGMTCDTNAMRFATAGRDALTNWWVISPGAIVEMLTRLGFFNTRVTCHSQMHHLGHKLDQAPIAMSMYTVVGERD